MRGTGNPIRFLQRSFGMDNRLQKGGHEEDSISERANCSPGKSLFGAKGKENKTPEENFWEEGNANRGQTSFCTMCPVITFVKEPRSIRAIERHLKKLGVSHCQNLPNFSTVASGLDVDLA
ncbi:hypothetical protein CDAR_277791 [Caerostris darwini]|uniref:Uncharacterized protein n=1 Tax=Caerostris darwini TaxID=1538125 RepID=A0AAV4V9M2_9ARAC|nr:hypothetical protein CDAR_277791 [Caerostris darwini]